MRFIKYWRGLTILSEIAANLNTISSLLSSPLASPCDVNYVNSIMN